MKHIQIDDTTYSMLNDLAKKHSQKSTQIIENVVKNLYTEMKRTGRKVL